MIEIEQAIAYYRNELKKASNAIQYIKDRGITADIVNEFKIGYAPANPTYNQTFKNRIMIPIQDTLGDDVAFVGRTIVNEDPKYKNSWESANYQKGRILFGFARAFPHIQKNNRVVLVEGQFDLLTLWQHGLKNVVAGSGTGFTAIHARLLSRYAAEVCIAYDCDIAGQKAMKKSSGLLKKAGLNVVEGKLPTDEDPDSFVRKYGIHEFIKLFKGN